MPPTRNRPDRQSATQAVSGKNNLLPWAGIEIDEVCNIILKLPNLNTHPRRFSHAGCARVDRARKYLHGALALAIGRQTAGRTNLNHAIKSAKAGPSRVQPEGEHRPQGSRVTALRHRHRHRHHISRRGPNRTKRRIRHARQVRVRPLRQNQTQRKSKKYRP